LNVLFRWRFEKTLGGSQLDDIPTRGHETPYPRCQQRNAVAVEVLVIGRHVQTQGPTLENLLDEPVTRFAYPNGKPGEDYSPSSVQIAKDLGFEAAVSTAWGASNAQTDLFQIPRFTPWDTGRW
jgi:hypothetical protein